MESERKHLSVEEIRALIRERKDEIKKEFRAEIVGIFGSYARGDEKEKSDIDVLVRFGEGATLLHLTGLGYYLEDLFGVSVDVVSERAIHPMMRDDVLRELVPL
jgi:predicted nucleotidyltransferase